MHFRQFQKILRASATLPVTRDDAFVRTVVGDAVPHAVRIPLFRRLTVGFAAVAATFAAFVAGFYGFHPAYTLSVDVNPSFEIAVNHFGVVIALRPLDAEAVAIAADLDWRGEQPLAVLLQLADAMRLDGYLEDGGSVLLGASATGTRSAPVTTTGTALNALVAVFGNATVLFVTDAGAGGFIAFKATSTFVNDITSASAQDERASVWDNIFDATAEGAFDAITTIVTTTATTLPGQDDVPTEMTDPNGGITYVDLDEADLARLAASFGITVAKLRIAIAIYNASTACQSAADLEALTAKPIDELLLLFQGIGQ